MNPRWKAIGSRVLPLGLPLVFGRVLALVAVLFFATLGFALAGWTSLFGEPQGWAQTLAIVSGVLFVLALVAVVALVRKALGMLRQGKQLLRRLSTR